MTRTAKLFTALGFVAVVGMVAAITVGFLAQSTSCTNLAKASADPELSHTILLEVAGNTTAWVGKVDSFVRERLTTTLGARPETPARVRIVMSVDGRILAPAQECLGEPLVLSPAESDLKRLERGTKATKNDLRDRLRAVRESQIEAVVRAVHAEVEGLAFGASGNADPVLTFLPLWHEAAGVRGWISLLSPLVSTAQDCLDPGGEDVPATELVADCVAAKVMPVLDGDDLHVENYPFLASSAGQIAAAREMIAAVTTCATPAGCAPPEKPSS